MTYNVFSGTLNPTHSPPLVTARDLPSMFWQSRATKHLDAVHRPNCTSVIALPTLCKVLMPFFRNTDSEAPCCKLRQWVRYGRSEVTKYISCMFEADFSSMVL